MMFGAPESLLPYQKKYIREAIVILLNFLKDKNAWDGFRVECPEIADSIITNKYYNALTQAIFSVIIVLSSLIVSIRRKNHEE